MKMECDIVRDLLPLYVEHISSEASNNAVREHLEKCPQCSGIYEKMKSPDPQVQYDKKPAESFGNYVKKEKKKLWLKTTGGTLVVAILLAVVIWLFLSGTVLALLSWSITGAKVYEDTDVSHYSQYMGKDAKKEYVSKLGMDETIFPAEITADMRVSDYKMVYYDPWDRQYLSYLVVDYSEEQYLRETERLKGYPSTEYKGYYGAEGFDEEYTLLAMSADSYNGFVYALAGKETQIIYVELLFCNYFYDLDYQNRIPEKYLPIGFDATLENPYREEILQKNRN